jgi:hypothetical protein
LTELLQQEPEVAEAEIVQANTVVDHSFQAAQVGLAGAETDQIRINQLRNQQQLTLVAVEEMLDITINLQESPLQVCKAQELVDLV